MGFIENNITNVVATLTLLSNIAFVIFIAVLLLELKFRNIVYRFVEKHVLVLMLAVSLGALIGSLLYSNILNFPPCELCWIQRICMYPQALLALIALKKKDIGILDYMLPLSVIGAIVAAYHSLVQMGFGLGVLGCTSVGGECARVYVLEYGYITIPFMALTTFVYLIAITLIFKKAKNAGR